MFVEWLTGCPAQPRGHPSTPHRPPLALALVPGQLQQLPAGGDCALTQPCRRDTGCPQPEVTPIPTFWKALKEGPGKRAAGGPRMARACPGRRSYSPAAQRTCTCSFTEEKLRPGGAVGIQIGLCSPEANSASCQVRAEPRCSPLRGLGGILLLGRNQPGSLLEHTVYSASVS